MATATARKTTARKSTKGTKSTIQAVAAKVLDNAQETDTTPAPEPKCSHARTQVAKPQAKMLRVIKSIGEHPGKALRIKRFDRYREGMTLQHCKVTEGLDHLDVLFYEEHGLMELREPTKQELEAAIKAWEEAKAKEAKAA